MISRPVVVSPVKAILAMRGLEASALPISAARAGHHVEHAGRQHVADQFQHHARLSGVFEAGLITTQLPAPMAGASFQAAISSGKFQGMICPTTPMGSLK
jgi:hypothetical protein